MSKKDMEDNYRNTESRDRESNYIVFEISRSFMVPEHPVLPFITGGFFNIVSLHRP